VAPFTKPTGDQCFQVDVRHIKLLTTGKGTESRLGLNRLLLYFDEAPVDRALDFGHVRVACVDVRYVDAVLKSPSDGLVSFSETDFKPAETFDPRKDCKDLTSIPMPTKDAGSP